MASFSASGIVVITSTVADARFRAAGVTRIVSQALGDPVFKDRSWYTFPARRIGYDLDGSQVFLVASERFDPDNKGTLTQIPQAAVEGMNGDYSSGLAIEGRRYVVVPDGTTFGHVEIDPGFWGEATYANQNNYVVIFFAEPMRLRAWYSQVSQLWQETHMNPNQIRDSEYHYPAATLEVSPDSTNGQDGTWHELDYREANLLTIALDRNGNSDSLTTSVKMMDGRWIGDVVYPETDDVYDPRDAYVNLTREEFTDGRLNDRGWFPLYSGWARGVTAVRLAVPAYGGRYGSIRGARILLHLYGEPDVGAGVRLAIVDPRTDVELKMDPSWGNVDLDSTNVITVGVKNMSPTLTATGVVVSIASSWPDGAPTTIMGDTNDNGIPDTYLPWLWSPLEGLLHVSTDETTWAESVAIGDLAPGETVQIFARQLPSDPAHAELPPFAIQAPDPRIIGLRFARILAETEGWV